eukprot:gene18606-biopygen12969
MCTHPTPHHTIQAPRLRGGAGRAHGGPRRHRRADAVPRVPLRAAVQAHGCGQGLDALLRDLGSQPSPRHARAMPVPQAKKKKMPIARVTPAHARAVPVSCSPWSVFDSLRREKRLSDLQGKQDTGTGMARVVSHFGLGWRGRGAGMVLLPAVLPVHLPRGHPRARRAQRRGGGAPPHAAGAAGQGSETS